MSLEHDWLYLCSDVVAIMHVELTTYVLRRFLSIDVDQWDAKMMTPFTRYAAAFEKEKVTGSILMKATHQEAEDIFEKLSLTTEEKKAIRCQHAHALEKN